MKIGVGVKKGNADMIAAVSDGLRIMQANQTQKKTFQHYGVDPSLEMPSTLLTQ
jgi:polar amino acid transport system substrate-binding protein